MRGAWIWMGLFLCGCVSQPVRFPELERLERPAQGKFFLELLSVELLAEPPRNPAVHIDDTARMLAAILALRAPVYTIETVREIGTVGEELMLAIPGQEDFATRVTSGWGRNSEYSVAESFVSICPNGDSATLECELETFTHSEFSSSEGAPPPSSSRRYQYRVGWPMAEIPLLIIPLPAWKEDPRRTQLVFVRAR